MLTDRRETITGTMGIPAPVSDGRLPGAARAPELATDEQIRRDDLRRANRMGFLDGVTWAAGLIAEVHPDAAKLITDTCHAAQTLAGAWA